MPPKLKEFLARWAISTLAVLVASYVIEGIHYEKPLDLVVAALLLGILTAFVRPFLLLLSLPLLVLTLGLFLFVINATLLYIVGWLMSPAFRVDSFGQAFWGSMIITLVSFFLHALTGTGTARVRVRRGGSQRPARKKPPSAGDGPVIDV